MDYTHSSSAAVDLASDPAELEAVVPATQRRRRHGIRGWIAIATLVTVSFLSYGGMLYLFDTHVKGESGAFAWTAPH